MSEADPQLAAESKPAAGAAGPNSPDQAPRRLFTVPVGVQDWVLLIARVLLGIILIAHGWQKLVLQGYGPSTEMFAQLGIPVPGLALTVVLVIEIIGGALLVLGLATPVVGILVVLDMLEAFVLVHAGAGIFAANGGWELVATIALGAATFAAVGPGRFGLDVALARRR